MKDNNDQVKRLQRYVGQLVQAKTLCDNRLRFLESRKKSVEGVHGESGENDLAYQPFQSSETNTISSQQSISLAFDAIMNSPFSRRYLYSYLEKHGKDTECERKNTVDQRAFARSAFPPYQACINFVLFHGIENIVNEYTINFKTFISSESFNNTSYLNHICRTFLDSGQLLRN